MVAVETCLTVSDVNRRLPLVRCIVRDIMELSSDLSDRRRRLNDLRGTRAQGRDMQSAHASEVLEMELELSRDEQQIAAWKAELHQIGGELTCAETGTVDFPAMVDGDRIWLCWRFDEPEVSSWRATERDGQRMPLEMLREQSRAAGPVGDERDEA